MRIFGSHGAFRKFNGHNLHPDLFGVEQNFIRKDIKKEEIKDKGDVNYATLFSMSIFCHYISIFEIFFKLFFKNLSLENISGNASDQNLSFH